MLSAVIVAGGPGERLWPFGALQNKCAYPVANVPVIVRLVEQLRAAGAADITVVTGHLGSSIRYALRQAPVECVEGAALQGPVAAALLGLQHASHDDVAVLCGDIVAQEGVLRDFLATYRSDRPELALLLSNEERDCSDAPRIAYDAAGAVQSVSRRDDAAGLPWCGVLAGHRDTLIRDWQHDPGFMPNTDVGAMPRMEGELPFVAELIMERGGEARAYKAGGWVIDVDHPWQLLEASVRAARERLEAIDRTVLGPGAFLSDAAHIAEDAHIVLGEGASIGAGCYVDGPLILGPGARLERGALVDGMVLAGAGAVLRDGCHVENGSVIGPDARIGHGAEFRGVLGANSILAHYCAVWGLIGSYVDIGAATVCGNWRFDNATPTHRVGERLIEPPYHGQVCYIGDRSRTGVNAMLMPGVKVGSYSCVGPGVVAKHDVPANTILQVHQEQEMGEWGPDRYRR